MSAKYTKKASPRNSIGEQQKAIKEAMLAFLEENGLDPKYASIAFSNNIGELDGSATSIEVLQPKGFRVSASNHCGADMEKCGTVMALMDKFVKAPPLEGFRTYVGFRNNVSAMTWEDVAAGMNEQFKRLGSNAKVDMSLFLVR